MVLQVLCVVAKYVHSCFCIFVFKVCVLALIVSCLNQISSNFHFHCYAKFDKYLLTVNCNGLVNCYVDLPMILGVSLMAVVLWQRVLSIIRELDRHKPCTAI